MEFKIRKDRLGAYDYLIMPITPQQLENKPIVMHGIQIGKITEVREDGDYLYCKADIPGEVHVFERKRHD